MKKATSVARRGRQTSLAFFFLLIMILSLSSVIGTPAYRIVDYDDFDTYPVGTNGTNLQPYGWVNNTGGLSLDLTKVQAFPGEEMIVCQRAVKLWNRVNSSYRPTINGSFDGIPLNFSYRYRYRQNPNSIPYASNNWFSVIPHGWQTTLPFGQIANADIRYYPNISNTAIIRFANGTATSCVGSDYYCINTSVVFNDDNYHEIQVDYYFATYPLPLVGAYKQVEYVSLFIDGATILNKQLLGMDGAGMLPQVYNATDIKQNGINKCGIFDYIMTFVYEAGETETLNANESVPDYMLAVDNEMPLYSIQTKDENNIATNKVVRSSSVCTPFPYGNTSILSAGCNPLYITFPLLIDAENDSIEYALECFDNTAVVYSDSFEKTTAQINEIYNDDCDYTTIAYTRPDGTSTFGIRFRSDLNCTQAILHSRFSGDYDIPNYLSDSASYVFEWDITPVTNAYYGFEFIDYNIDTQLYLEWLYNSTTGTSYLLNKGAILYDYTGFDNSSTMSWRLFLDKSDSTASLRIRQGIKTIYTGKIPFTWSYPLSYLIIGSKSITGANFKEGQLFGNFSISSVPTSTFSALSGAVLNCSALNYATYGGIVYITDSEHGDNYLDYERFVWETIAGSETGALINATNPLSVQQTFDDLFLNSPFLKYLFALILFLAIVFGSFTASAYLGNAMAGVYIALFSGTACVFFLVLFGILPSWMAIVIFLVMAIIGAFALKNAFVTGGE